MKKYGVSILLLVLALVCVPAISTQAQTNSSSDAALPAPETTASAPFSATHSINLLPSAGVPKAPSANSDEFSKWEVMFGYSFLSNNIAVVDDGELRQGVHGYAAQFVYNMNNHVGLMFDFSGHNGTDTAFGFHQTEDQYYYIFGSVFSQQIGKVRVSGHFGAGIARQHYGEFFCSGECDNFGVKQTNFAAEAGGAVDFFCHKHWGIRFIQMDYLFSEFDGESLSNLRVSAGVIVRF